MSGEPVIVFYTDSVVFGGAEAALAMLVHQLSPELDVVLAGVEPAVVERVAEQRPGARTAILPGVRGRDVAGFTAMFRRIRRLRPQIFQANLPVPSSCQYALAAALLPPAIPAIAVEHIAYPLDGALQRGLKRFTSARLAGHVAVGEQVGRDVERLAHLAPGSVRTIHNGVADTPLGTPACAFDGPVVGSIGRLDRQKGFDVLIRAFSDVPGAHLVLVGDGPERAALEALAADVGISERVHFEGWRDEARRYLTIFDVFALASRFEGLPLAIVEAMLAGVPVVASRVGSVAEAVGDGETGTLVPPEDPAALALALRTLLADSKRREEMGARGRDRAAAFSPAAMARAYEQLYEEILS